MKKENFKNMVGANPCVHPMAGLITSRIMTMMITLIICLLIISCGGGKKNDASTATDVETLIEEQVKESATQTEITASNWQREIKKCFGMDIEVPQGWSFDNVRTYFDGEIVIVLFARENDDDAAKPSEIANSIFNITKAISTEGNFSVDVNSETYKVSKGTEYENFDQTRIGNVSFFGEEYINSFWYYKNGGIKVVNLDCDKGDKFSIKLEISKISI